MSEPPQPISSKPPCERDDALAVLKQLRDAGHVAYFAGGCVRDELMGLQPKDYDVATDAPPPRVRELFTNTQAVGAAFGVILVRHRRSVVEVATFRTDVSYEDGRRPTAVTFTTAEEDAKRRDFTINGLFLDPLENRVIDYVGGQEDIRNKVLRAIGNPDERFAEDHLRLLRAMRFASRFKLTIESATDKAIRRHRPHLTRISPERIADELRLMLTGRSRAAAWQLLRDFSFFPIIFRFVERRGADEVVGRGTDTIFLKTAPGEAVPFGLALAAASLAYLWPRGGGSDLREWLTRASVEKIDAALRKSLKISYEESDTLKGTLGGAGILLKDELPTIATLKRFLARATAGQTRALLRALAAAGLYVDRIQELDEKLAQLAQADYAPPPLLTGDDLVARGLTPGPAFKRALDLVYDEQLEGRVITREQALELGEGKVREFEAGKRTR